MDLEQFAHLLQNAVSPVILISGVGLLLLSLTNRLGRVIDRARVLADRARHESSPEDQMRFATQLPVLWRRARLLRMSISAAGLSMLLSAVLILLLFLAGLVQFGYLAHIIAGLFAGALVAVIVAVIYFLRDVNLSLRALALEIDRTGDND